MKKRIAAVVLAVLCMAVCVVPAFAVYGDKALNGVWSAYTNKSAYKHLEEYGRLNVFDVLVEPAVWSFTEVDFDFNTEKSWSYVAFEASVENADLTGCYVVGFYRRASDGKTMLRIGKEIRDWSNDGASDSEFPINAPISDDVDQIGVSIGLVGSGADRYVELSYYGIDANGDIVDVERRVYALHAKATNIVIQSKTNYASFWSFCYDASNEVRHDVPDVLLNTYLKKTLREQGYSEGYAACESGYAESGKAIWNIMSMPVDLLANVLNFNFFGINVWALASGLFTVALIIFVLKKVGVF